MDDVNASAGTSAIEWSVFMFQRASGARKQTRSDQIFFIQAKAGSGKSYLLNQIITQLLRASGRIVVVSAATAMAATVLHHGTTAHRPFGMLIHLQDDSVSSLPNESDQPQMHTQASLFIVDEATQLSATQMLNSTVFRLQQDNEPFGVGRSKIHSINHLQMPTSCSLTLSMCR